jgi:CBS domain-containing protein
LKGGSGGPSLSALLPGLFKLDRHIADGKSPLIYAGSVLSDTEAHILPVTKGLRPRRDPRTGLVRYGALTGYSFLERFAKTRPKDYYRLLWTPSAAIATWIGSVSFDAPLGQLLQVFETTNFGVSRVEGRGMHTIVTLADLVGCMRSYSLVTNMRVRQVGSKPVSISQDASVGRAVEEMLRFRVRRLFLKDRPLVFIPSRSIIEFMFTPERLQTAQNRPDEWCDAKVSVLDTQRAKIVSPTTPLNEAAGMIGDLPDDCLVSKDGHVISRWDLVMKPWKLGLLNQPGFAGGKSPRS